MTRRGERYVARRVAPPGKDYLGGASNTLLGRVSITLLGAPAPPRGDGRRAPASSGRVAGAQAPVCARLTSTGLVTLPSKP